MPETLQSGLVQTDQFGPVQFQSVVDQTSEILGDPLMPHSRRSHHHGKPIHELPALFVRPRHIEVEKLIGGPET